MADEKKKEYGDIGDGELNKVAGGFICYPTEDSKTCITKGCGKPAVRDGLCTECYNKKMRPPVRL